MPVTVDRSYLLAEIVDEITRSGHIPVEHREQFAQELTRDVEYAVRRYRAGLAANFAQTMTLLGHHAA